MEEQPNKIRQLSNEEVQDAQIGLLEWEIEEFGVDHLTGLKTRKAFTETLERAVKAMQRGDEQRKGTEPLSDLSIIFIDLDNFKEVNDTYGHDEGDKALVEAAKVISNSLREGQDVVGRFGGDEFYAFLPRTKRDDVKAVGEKILQNIRASELLNAHNVTASIGVFCATPGNSAYMSVEDLIKRADVAQFRAKKEGKNTIVIDDAE